MGDNETHHPHHNLKWDIPLGGILASDGLECEDSSLPFVTLFYGKYPSAYMPLEKASEELKA